MSDKYIEKEDAIQSIIAHDIVGIDSRGWAEYLLENTSTADVAPVRHGKWIDKSGGIEGAWNYCSVCGERAIELYDYCPNCGAKMEDDNETD